MFGQQVHSRALMSLCSSSGICSENLAFGKTASCIKNPAHGRSHHPGVKLRPIYWYDIFPAFTNETVIPLPCLLVAGEFCPSGLIKHQKSWLYLLISLSGVPFAVVSEATQAMTLPHSLGGRERSQGFIAAAWELTHY